MFLKALILISMTFYLSCGKRKGTSAPELGKYVGANVDTVDDEIEFEPSEAEANPNEEESVASDAELNKDLNTVDSEIPVEKPNLDAAVGEEESEMPVEAVESQVDGLTAPSGVFVEQIEAVQMRNSFTGADVCLGIEGVVSETDSLKMIDCVLAQTSWFKKTREDGTNLVYQSSGGVDYCLTINPADVPANFTTVICGSEVELQGMYIVVEPSPVAPYVMQISMDADQKMCLDVYSDTFKATQSDCSALSTAGTWWTLLAAP